MDLFRSIAKLFGARFATSVISFTGLTFFAQSIGAEQLGIFFLFQAVINISMLPANFGLRGAMEKRVSGSTEGDSFFSTTILLKIFPLAIISALIIAFDQSLNEYIGAEVAGLVVLGLVIEEANQVVIHLLRGELRVSRSADLLLLKQLVWVGGGAVAVVYFESGAEGLVMSWILGSAVTFSFGMYIKSTTLGTVSWHKAQSLFNYAKFDVVSGTGATLFSWLDVIIIGFFLTQTAVGAYETAWRLSAVAVMFGNAVRSAIFPQISAWESTDAFGKISSTLTDIVSASLFFVIPSIVGIIVLAEELLVIVFGQEFVIATIALSILIGQKLFQALNQSIGRTLQAINFPDLAAYAMIVGVLTNILLNFVLIDQYGIEGAAVATFTSYGLMTLTRTYYLSNHMDIVIEWRDVGWFVVAASVMGVAVWQVKSTVGVDGIYSLLGIVSLGVIVYFLLTFLSPTVRSKVIAKASDLFGNTTSFGD
jgi:O-antigen/teichoic acid export membrane protein